MPNMPNLAQPTVKTADRPLTAEWAAELAYWSAQRGLPPEPWPLP